MAKGQVTLGAIIVIGLIVSGIGIGIFAFATEMLSNYGGRDLYAQGKTCMGLMPLFL